MVLNAFDNLGIAKIKTNLCIEIKTFYTRFLISELRFKL